MQRRSLIRNAAVVVGLAPLGGCQTLWNLLRAGLQEPNVRITKMTLDDVALDKVKMLFDTEIENPNPIGVALAGFGYALEIEGDQLARGDIDRDLKLKPKGSSSLQFPVEVALGATANAILKLLEKDEASYGIDTAFRFKLPEVGKLEVPVSFDGKFPVPKIPAMEVRGVRFTSIGPGGLGMRFTTNVKNTNKFAIPIQKFRFNFDLNGRTVLKNEPVSGLSLKAGQSRDIPVDFTFGLVEAGLTIASLAQNPTLSWKVGAKVESGILDIPFEQAGKIKLA